MIDLNIGSGVEAIIDWLTINLEPVFDALSAMLDTIMTGFEGALLFPPTIVTIVLLSLLAWWIAGRGVGIFSLIGLLLIDSMGYWEETMVTLSQVGTSALVALIIGIPIGIWASR
ncbi:MAG TPA: glycine/betaine ABC transporter, partial [bacterium]|nr:glycine/betaine ABC transporter [bacterium]